MSFHDSKFFYWADAKMEGCDRFRQATEELLNPAGTPGMLQWSAADTQVFIVGRQNTTQNLVNLVTGEVHGEPALWFQGLGSSLRFRA